MTVLAVLPFWVTVCLANEKHFQFKLNKKQKEKENGNESSEDSALGREAPLTQVPPLSFSFEGMFNLNSKCTFH